MFKQEFSTGFQRQVKYWKLKYVDLLARISFTMDNHLI